MGDFNFDNEKEDKRIPENFIDIWKVLRKPEEEGFTMKKTKHFPVWRPDRICMKKNNNMRPILIERIGMEVL